MPNKKPTEFITITNILVAIGIIIICVGIYFIKNELTSSGPKMGKYSVTGTGTIDGKGMVFCGIIIAGFGWIIRDTKQDLNE